MKKYKSFLKLMVGGILNGFALILRGVLMLAYILIFCIWLVFKGIAEVFNKLINLIDKINKKLKKRDK